MHASDAMASPALGSGSDSECARVHARVLRGCVLRARARGQHERARGCGRRALHLSQRASRRAGLAC